MLGRNSLFREWWGTGTHGPKKLRMIHSWRCSSLRLLGPWAAWCSGRQPSHGRGFGTGWSLRSFPSKDILWLYDLHHRLGATYQVTGRLPLFQCLTLCAWIFLVKLIIFHSLYISGHKIQQQLGIFFFFFLWWIVGRQHPFRPFPAGGAISLYLASLLLLQSLILVSVLLFLVVSLRLLV